MSFSGIFSDEFSHCGVQLFKLLCCRSIFLHGLKKFFQIQPDQSVGLIAVRVFPVFDNLGSHERRICHLLHDVFDVLLDTGSFHVPGSGLCQILFIESRDVHLKVLGQKPSGRCLRRPATQRGILNAGSIADSIKDWLFAVKGGSTLCEPLGSPHVLDGFGPPGPAHVLRVG